MEKITWVCATYAQHFTRAYGADRHNNNLHEGKGTVVRLLDYIVGRINGQFLPNDPLAYRRKKGKDKKRNPLFGSNHDSIYNNSFRPKVIADSVDDMLSYENIMSNPPSKINGAYNSDSKYDDDNINERSYHSNRVSQPLHKVDNVDNRLLSSPTDKLVERRLKLEEFKMLLNKYYAQQNASQILAFVTYITMLENDDNLLDRWLSFLHNIGKGESYHENAVDKSVGNNKDNAAILQPPVFDFTLLQPMLDKKATRSTRDEHIQVRAKLAEIRQILSPFCPPQFVQHVITGLIDIYNAGWEYFCSR
jgi:hypothetical protein